MEFRGIDRSNYWDCMELVVDDSQKGFVADNSQSLAEAAFEDGIFTLGIYAGDTMVGFLLYCYDDSFPGWYLCRFMIGKQFQGKGYGKQAALEFLDYFKKTHNAEKLYTSVVPGNTAARRLWTSIGFRDLNEVEFTFRGKHYTEQQMVIEL